MKRNLGEEGPSQHQQVLVTDRPRKQNISVSTIDPYSSDLWFVSRGRNPSSLHNAAMPEDDPISTFGRITELIEKGDKKKGVAAKAERFTSIKNQDYFA